MKRHLTLILFAALLVINTFAATFHVTNSTEFANALSSSSNGDIIYVASGSYSLSDQTLSKGLSILAEPDAVTKPIVKTCFTITASANFYVDGIEFYYDVEGAATPSGKYFLDIRNGGPFTFGTISLTNSVFHGYGRSLIRGDSNSPVITNLIVNNCLIYDMGRNSAGYNIFALKTTVVTNATITNSTFYNSPNALWYSEITTSPITFNLKNCNLLKISSSGSQNLISFNGNAGSVYTIEDCIISDSYDATTAKMVIRLNVNNSTTFGHLKNTILANNFGASKFSSTTLTTNTEVAVSSLSFDYASLLMNTTPNSITGIGDPRWTLNPAVATPRTLSLTTTPEGAGTASANPTKVEYEDGESVSLTAERNFGYAFSHWADAGDNVISTSNPYALTMNENKTLKAVFSPINTYTLGLTVSGAPSYMVAISPVGTMVGADRKYETGTNVTLTAANNPILTFTNWSTGETNATKVVNMDQDRSITAVYSAVDYIVGWDFYQAGSNNRIADFYSNAGNSTSALIMRKADGTTSSWLDKSVASGSYYSRGAAVNWRAFADRYYYQTSFVATGYTNIKVAAAMLYNYNAYSVQKCEYSLDGTNFTSVGTYTMSVAQNWYSATFDLPAECDHAARVYVRWIPDYTSAVVGAASANDGTSISTIYITATAEVYDDGVAPVLVSTVPAANATNASVSGKVVLNFDENVMKTSGSVVGTLGSVELTPVVAGKVITFSYSGLSYNTQYTFSLPGGSVADLGGNALATPVSVTFTTMSRPTPSAKTYDFIVASDGSGNGLTIQSAFNAVPTDNSTPYLIFVKNGTYSEYASLAANKSKVSLIGQSRDGVIITGSRYSGLVDGGITYTTSTCQTLEILASDFYGENFTVRNTAGVNAGQAVALKSYGDKNAFKNVKLMGYQDTHLTGTGRQLYLKCDIRGTVDFIFGGGDVFFDECLLYCEGRSSGDVITAPATGVSLEWGYVFNNCTIDGDAATQNNNYYLGRPWQNAPRAVYINTKMNILPNSAGWTNMAVSPALFAEYNSVNASSETIDLSNRKSSYTKDESNGGGTTTGHQTILSGVEAATYTMDNVLSGNDDWNPLLKTDVTAAPGNVRVNASGEILWDAAGYAIGYLVLKNNIVIANTTSLNYTDAGYTGTDVYRVIAVAEYGAISESALATTSAASDHFRSYSSGNWNDEDSWESSSDNVNWHVATLSPTNSAASVKIMAGHLITVSSEANSSGLTVQEGAKLTIATGQTLNITGNLLLESSSIATASLLNQGTCAVSGTSSVQQYMTSGRNWYFASPVSNATSAVLKSVEGNKLWERNVSANNWTEITTTNVELTPLKGYVGKVAGSGIVTFTGSLNNGDITPVTLTSYGVASGKFHLVGNPYPSYLNWQSVIAANADVMPTMWMRTKTLAAEGQTSTYTFATVQIASGEPIVVSNNAFATVTKYIPPMQAVWVRINDGVSSTQFAVNNSMRAHADITGNRFKVTAAVNQLLRLEVSNGINSDETVIYFNANASDNYDQYDSPKMFNNTAAMPEIFTTIGNEQLVINGMNMVYPGKTLALGFNTLQTSNFSIRATQMNNFDSDLLVVLKDKFTGSEFDLTSGESYEFSSTETSGSDRFVVMFKSASGTTSVDDAIAGNMYVSTANSKLMLQLNAEISNASVTVYNATGQSIHSQDVAAPTTVLNKSLDAGVYVLKVTNGGRTMVLRTIVY